MDVVNKESYAKLLAEDDFGVCSIKQVCSTNLQEVRTDFSPQSVYGIIKNSPICWDETTKQLCYINSECTLCTLTWNGEEYEEKCIVRVGNRVSSMIIHPTKRECVCGGPQGIFVWNLDKHTQEYQIPDIAISSLCWCMGGMVLAVGTTDGYIHLYDTIESYSLIESFYAHKSSITCVFYCQSRAWLLSAGHDSIIYAWNISHLQPLLRDLLPSETPTFSSLPFISTSTSTSTSTTISTTSCVCMQTFSGHAGDISALTTTSDGEQLFSGGRNGSIRVWNMNTGKCTRHINDISRGGGFGSNSGNSHSGAIVGLYCILEDRCLVVGSMDGRVDIYRMKKEEKEEKEKTGGNWQVYGNYSEASVFDQSSENLSLDELLANITESTSMEFDFEFNRKEEEEKEKMGGRKQTTTRTQTRVREVDELIASYTIVENGGLHQLVLSHNQTKLGIISTSSNLWQYSLQWKEPELSVCLLCDCQIRSHSGMVTALASNDSCNVITASHDHHILITDQKSHLLLQDIPIPFAASTLLTLQNVILVAGHDYRVHVRSPKDLSFEFTFAGHSGNITSMAYSRNLGLLIVGSEDVGIMLISAFSNNSSISSITCYSPPDFSTPRVINHQTLQPCSSANHQGGHVTAVDIATAFNDHPMVVSGGSDYSLFVYSLRGAHYQLKLYWKIPNAHEGVISSVLFGVGMAIGVLYSAAQDGVIKLWNICDRSNISNLTYHSGKVVALCQTPEGRFLVSAAVDGFIIVYDVHAEYRVVARHRSNEQPSSLAIVNGMIMCGFVSGAVRSWSLPSISYTPF